MHIHVTLEGGDAPRTFYLNGRLGWTFYELHTAGKRGVTPVERPAPRWSGYVHDLRGMGIAIDTEMVPHGGTYSGHHARYRLACNAVVQVLK